MEVRAVTRYVRISPSKANDVARLIRGMKAAAALDALQFMPRKAARIIRKTLQSAVANAENNAQLSVDDLVVKSAEVGTGPTLKRHQQVARGSAHPILKRTSHIKIVLSDNGSAGKTRTKAAAKSAKTVAPKAGKKRTAPEKPAESAGESKAAEPKEEEKKA